MCSWINDSIEQLFLSNQAIFAENKAIRGGVPVIFPQFEEFGPGARHGFARTSQWRDTKDTSNTSIEFALRADKNTQKAWPFDFEALYRASIQHNALSLALTVKNTDSKPFSFTAALHTYLRVSDIRQCVIQGLDECEYWTNGTGKELRNTQKEQDLSIKQKIDRIYFDVAKPVRLIESTQQRSIKSNGFSDIVVWNPWDEDVKSMSDMGNNEYLQMVCIESAQVGKPIQLQTGESWTGEQTITVEN